MSLKGHWGRLGSNFWTTSNTTENLKLQPDDIIEQNLKRHEKSMRTDIKYRYKALDIDKNYTDTAAYFVPR